MQALLGAAHLDSAWVLEIDWPDGTTGRYADRAVQIEGDTYLAVVSAWGRLERSDDGGAAGGSAIDVIMSHGDALWIEMRGQDVVGAVVRFGLHAIGTAAVDIAWLWGGALARVEIVSDLTTRLHVHSALEDLPGELPVHTVDSSMFPDARPDIHGRALPLVYGGVPNLPALPVRTSAVTALRGAIAATSTSLDVEDASAPVAFPDGAVILRIDDEYVAGSFSGNTFAISQRGAAAVTAAVADSGTDATLVDAARTEPDGAWMGFSWK